jgi:hypothetical protein
LTGICLVAPNVRRLVELSTQILGTVGKGDDTRAEIWVGGVGLAIFSVERMPAAARRKHQTRQETD